MTFTEWTQLALICVLGAMSPGPSLAVVIKNTVAGGRGQGILTGIGHGIGITFYAVIAVAGLVTLMKMVPHFFSIAQIVGAVFLGWLGGKMIYSVWKSVNSDEPEPEHHISRKRGFMEGFLIAFLNPKIAAWLLALFSQFVKPDAALSDQLLLVSTVGGIDASWYCLLAWLASSEHLIKILRRNAKRLDFGMGVILILMAGGMLWRSLTML